MPNKALALDVETSAGKMVILRSIRVQMVATSWKHYEDVRVAGCRMGSPGNPWGCQTPTYWGVRDSDAHPTQYTMRLGRGAGLPSSQHSFMNYCEAEALILGWWARLFR